MDPNKAPQNDRDRAKRGARSPDHELQDDDDDRKPSPKRPNEQDQDSEDEPSQKRRRTALDEKRLEARRRSNRLSAQRARIRTKTTIAELQESQANLRAANNLLCRQLEEALSENRMLRRIMGVEMNNSLERNRALTLSLEQRLSLQRLQGDSSRVARNNVPSSLGQLVRAADAVSSERRAPLRSASLPNGFQDQTASLLPQQMPQERALLDAQIYHLQRELQELERRKKS